MLVSELTVVQLYCVVMIAAGMVVIAPRFFLQAWREAGGRMSARDKVVFFGGLFALYGVPVVIALVALRS